jgi:hypothetical protein
MKAEVKNRIRQIAEEKRESNEIDLAYNETEVKKSWFTCIREAINYVELKRSNKLSECRGQVYDILEKMEK